MSRKLLCYMHAYTHAVHMLTYTCTHTIHTLTHTTCTHVHTHYTYTHNTHTLTHYTHACTHTVHIYLSVSVNVILQHNFFNKSSIIWMYHNGQNRSIFDIQIFLLFHYYTCCKNIFAHRYNIFRISSLRSHYQAKVCTYFEDFCHLDICSGSKLQQFILQTSL